MATSKKINVLALARLQAIVVGFIGLVLGVIYSIGGAFYDLLTTGLNYGSFLALGALIAMPIIFASIGFVLGVIEALIYNSISRWVKVKIEL